ncbi:MAG: M15 family metallopeptidase [Pseudomonadales bacterium]|jgi:LAS superfamily LD-carboxypeptidase LdcB|tara:strand:- start:559 stop:1233 length:675 start_codon:yes stop_codon:yes gene_type:complete
MADHDILTGSTERHLRRLNPAQPIMIHAQVVEPFVALQAQSAKQGFDLQICSGFRSFERQLHIWNGKLSGLRPVVDKAGNPIVLEALSPWDQIQAVLRWSALPGASRHHWGTDFDVYDAAAMPEGYQIQLTPEEVEGAGIFAPMHDWLDRSFDGDSLGFYRPYGTDKGGVAPERWHLSYAPIADIYAREHSADVIAERLACSELLLLDVVLENLDEIVRRFVQV